MSEAHTGTPKLKTGLAEMLKGGVIMDVTTAEQARIAQEAGADPWAYGSARALLLVARSSRS